jgi:hypothetical protein
MGFKKGELALMKYTPALQSARFSVPDPVFSMEYSFTVLPEISVKISFPASSGKWA